MKTTYALAIMAIAILFTATAVMAKQTPKEDPVNQGFNYECQNFYGDNHYFTIEKWAYDTKSGDYLLSEQNELYKYYDIAVTGDLKDADWTSRNRFYSVLVKAGDDRVAFDTSVLNAIGQRSGAVNSTKDISHLTFCGKRSSNNGGGGSDGNGVPEFPALAMGVAVLIATLGIVILRKN